MEFKVTSGYLIALYGCQCSGLYIVDGGLEGFNFEFEHGRLVVFVRWQNVLKLELETNKDKCLIYLSMSNKLEEG